MSELQLDATLSDEEGDSTSSSGSQTGKSSTKVPETLLRTVLANLQSAKRDLDKHWLYLIVATALSLAIPSELGGLVSKRLMGEAGHESLLFVLMPCANLYLFMRFGFLLAYFTGVRYAAEDLAEVYFSEHNIVESKSITTHLLFGTNSFFEYIHERKWKWGLLLYLIFILSTLALNQAASLQLLWLYFGSGSKLVLALLYSLGMGFLCYHYYDGNKDRRTIVMGSRTAAIAVFVNLGLTLAFFLFLVGGGLAAAWR